MVYLLYNEQRYQDLYDHAPDMFVSVMADSGKIIQCNQTLANHLNYTKDEMLGLHILKLYHPDSETDRQRVFKTFISTGIVNNAELQLMRKDGSKLDVSLNISAVRDEQGKVIYSRSTWRDISQHKQLEEQLRGSQKMEALGTMAGGIAHDFNNILGSVMGNTELCMRSVGHCLKLEVRDSGKGIAAERQSQVFDPFYTTKAVGKGTGLGLFMVHNITKNHQGKIICESEPARAHFHPLFSGGDPAD